MTEPKCEYCDAPAEGIALGPVQPDGTRQHVLACKVHGDRAAQLLRGVATSQEAEGP